MSKREAYVESDTDVPSSFVPSFLQAIKGNFFLCSYLLLFSSSSFNFSSFDYDEHPSESRSISIAMLVSVPPIFHDDVLLLKIPYHFIPVHLDDVMRMRTELDLMGYALITSKAR